MRLLTVIPALGDPNLALAVLCLGVLAGAIEFVRPGWVFPAAVGGVLVALGAAALATQPLRWAAVLAAALALAMFACACWWGWRMPMVVAGAVVIGATAALTPGLRWWVAAVCSGPVLAALGWLLPLARRAGENKAIPGG